MLVGGQFAIATPLLVIAGLLLASLNELKRVDLGFDTPTCSPARSACPPHSIEEPGRVDAFWDELRRASRPLPGVTGVAFSDGRPPNDVGNMNNFDLEETPAPPAMSQPAHRGSRYHRSTSACSDSRWLEGRLLNDRDGLADGPSVVVVDRAWAKRFFPDSSAVGKRLHGGGCTACPWTTVVGVVSDVKYEGLDRPDEGTVYTPISDRPFTFPIETGTSRFRYLVLRTSAAPATMLPSVRHALSARWIPGCRSPALRRSTSWSRSRCRGRSPCRLLVGAFAVIALALSLFGVYGMMVYYVQQHLKEISIRLALGGSAAIVLRLIVGNGMESC